MSVRIELANYVLDERNTPLAIVGAAVAYMKVTTRFGPRLAAAIDEAIKQEVKAIQKEADLLDKRSLMDPRRK